MEKNEETVMRGRTNGWRGRQIENGGDGVWKTLAKDGKQGICDSSAMAKHTITTHRSDKSISSNKSWVQIQLKVKVPTAGDRPLPLFEGHV